MHGYTQRDLFVGSRPPRRPHRPSPEPVLSEEELTALWHATFELPERWRECAQLSIALGCSIRDCLTLETKELLALCDRGISLPRPLMAFLSSCPENATPHAYAFSAHGRSTPLAFSQRIVDQWRRGSGVLRFKPNQIRRLRATLEGDAGSGSQEWNAFVQRIQESADPRTDPLDDIDL